MISDKQYDSLEWQEIEDVEELKGSVIDDAEPIMAGYADKGGGWQKCGLILYLTDKTGCKHVLTVETVDTGVLTEPLNISLASIPAGEDIEA